MEEERQGIGSILRSQTHRPKTAASLRLRRSISADISCSSCYSWSPSSEGQDIGEVDGNVGGKFDKSNQDKDIGGKFDKVADDSSESWSAFSLNQKKSLEVCTENLGSETGSEGFLSDDPPSKESQIVNKPAQKNKKEPQLPHQVSSPSIPPALQSFPGRRGPGFLLRSHRRDDGCLIEAVPFSISKPNTKAAVFSSVQSKNLICRTNGD